MYSDPIVQEIHQIREQHCQQFQFDLHKLFADVKQREQHSHKHVVNLSIKRKRILTTIPMNKAEERTKRVAEAC